MNQSGCPSEISSHEEGLPCAVLVSDNDIYHFPYVCMGHFGMVCYMVTPYLTTLGFPSLLCNVFLTKKKVNPQKTKTKSVQDHLGITLHSKKHKYFFY